VSDVILAVLERRQSAFNALEAARRLPLLIGHTNVVAWPLRMRRKPYLWWLR
jgi:hypothetical protein